jgi:hypothetical protein
MRYRTRTYYTDAQKALMWERWKQGWTLHVLLICSIARTIFIVGRRRGSGQ